VFNGGDCLSKLWYINVGNNYIQFKNLVVDDYFKNEEMLIIY
jgi:hypothetical protein